MRPYAVALVPAVAALCLTSLHPASAAAQEHRFTIHNSTGAEIVDVEIAPAGSGRWSANILGEIPIDRGAVKTLVFGHPEDPCIVDVALLLRPGGRTILPNQNACSPAFVAFTAIARPPAQADPAGETPPPGAIARPPSSEPATQAPVP